MANEHISPPESERLAVVVEELGGITKASRKLDLPYRALKNALDGEAMREGSVLVVRARLAAYEESSQAKALAEAEG